MHIAVYKTETDTSARTGEIDWADLVGDLTSPAEEAHECAGHDCPRKFGACWSPVELSVPIRADKNVKFVTALVFDLDRCALTPDDISAKLMGYAHILHSTHSHSASAEGLGAYRVIVQLAVPVPAAVWPDVWARAVAFFDLPADAACKNLSRVYFFPSVCTPAARPFIGYAREGKALDVTTLPPVSSVPFTLAAPPVNLPAPEGAALSTTPKPEAEAPPVPESVDLDEIRAGIKALRKPESRAMLMRLVDAQPMAAVGSRDNTINAAMSALAGVRPRPSLDALMMLVVPSLRRMELNPEGEQYWIDKAVSSFERACKRMDESDARETAQKAVTLALIGKGNHPLVEAGDWREKLVRAPTTGNIKGNEANADLILSNEGEWKGALRFNEVTKAIDVFGGPLEGEAQSSLPLAAATWLQAEPYRLDISPNSMGAVLLRMAKKNAYDPLKTYLEGLTWDGENRIDTYLSRFCKKNEFTTTFGRKWAIGAVARALKPGCKMDNALILIGDYGTRKTGFVETMAGEFFSNGKIDFTSKDAHMMAARFWIIEMAEMGSYRRADSDAVKDWLSTCTDSYRPPYGAAVENYPRRSVFVGTSNNAEILQEPNRREWICEVARIDIDWLKENRNQIWAEAVTLYRGGETWWLDSALEARIVREHTRDFAAPQEMVDNIVSWWTSLPKEKRTPQAGHDVANVVGYSPDKQSPRVLSNVARALTGLGFKRKKVRVGEQTLWRYAPSQEAIDMEPPK